MQPLDFSRDVLPLRDRLYRLALRITLDSEEARDVVQETMLRAWDRREQLSEIGSIEAWCTAVAKHLALDRYEQLKGRRGLSGAPQGADMGSDVLPATSVDVRPGMGSDVGSAESPQVLLERGETVRLVVRLMSGLPLVQRQVMHLRDVEGCSYRQIAQALGLSDSQVKVYLHRAREKVKQQLACIEDYGVIKR